MATTGNVAGDEQIPDMNLAASGIDFHSDSAGGGDENLALAFFTQSNARLFGDHSGDTRVVANS